MGSKLRQADEVLWAVVDALTLFFFVVVPLAALFIGAPLLLLMD